MKNVLVVSILLFSLTTTMAAGSGTHWSYSGKEGPNSWGDLSPEYKTCSSGKNQSPINLTGFIESTLEPIKIHYREGGKEVINNGHAIQVNYTPGSKVIIDKKEFELKQFHFHAPSEHHIDGKSFPMEAHFVHSDLDGNLAVIGVMFSEGRENEALAQVWANMPEKAGLNIALSSPSSAEAILPQSRTYYRYNGSLTTPPCSEGVMWIVMKDSVTVSKTQIQKFIQIMQHSNNRPVQSVNARPLLQ